MATYNYNSTGTSTSMGDWNPAVLQLQKDLNKKGAGLVEDGKYGPKTQAAQQKYGGQQSTPTTPSQPTNTNSSEDGFNGNNAMDVLRDYYGVDPAILAKYPAQLWNQDFGPVATYIQQQAQNGNQMDAIDTSNFFDAYEAASKDPTIKSIYGDALKLDKSGLFQNLNYLNTLYGIDQQTQERNFRKQQETLKENVAQGGQTYSGFRGQAQKDLDQEQQGVIQSKRAELKNKVFQIGSGLEKIYGTNDLDQFGNIRIGNESYNDIGGITGSRPIQKEQDIIDKQKEIYGMMSYPTK